MAVLSSFIKCLQYLGCITLRHLTTNLHFRSWLQKSSKDSILQSKRATKKEAFFKARLILHYITIEHFRFFLVKKNNHLSVKKQSVLITCDLCFPKMYMKEFFLTSEHIKPTLLYALGSIGPFVWPLGPLIITIVRLGTLVELKKS